jgi:hypothetical protein
MLLNVSVIFQRIGPFVFCLDLMDQRFQPAEKSLVSLSCLSMLTLLKHAYSTRLNSGKHVKMSAIKLTIRKRDGMQSNIISYACSYLYHRDCSIHKER